MKNIDYVFHLNKEVAAKLGYKLNMRRDEKVDILKEHLANACRLELASSK